MTNQPKVKRAPGPPAGGVAVRYVGRSARVQVVGELTSDGDIVWVDRGGAIMVDPDKAENMLTQIDNWEPGSVTPVATTLTGRPAPAAVSDDKENSE